jgi:signal peptidase II
MWRRRSLTFGLAALVLVLDQLTKSWAQSALPRLGRTGIVIIGSCFNLAYAENRSAAFGLLDNLPYDTRRLILTGFAVVAVLALVGLVVANRIQRDWTAAATGLILGGAIGNVIDRARLGFVVDFIVWHIGEKFYWPTFNIADSGIVIGVFILLWVSYWVDRRSAAQAP